MKLILASSSPRRAEILRQAGISFEVCATHVDEIIHAGESARAMVARLAEAKARAGALKLDPAMNPFDDDSIVIGADTAVEVEGRIFGKPSGSAEAREMLVALSGKGHYVHTGIFLLRVSNGEARSTVETTSVQFVSLDGDEIDTYVASGEPFDKAGGYAIQGRAGCFISRIEGCYFNVVGLPLARLGALLGELGWTGGE